MTSIEAARLVQNGSDGVVTRSRVAMQQSRAARDSGQCGEGSHEKQGRLSFGLKQAKGEARGGALAAIS